MSGVTAWFVVHLARRLQQTYLLFSRKLGTIKWQMKNYLSEMKIMLASTTKSTVLGFNYINRKCDRVSNKLAKQLLDSWQQPAQKKQKL